MQRETERENANSPMRRRGLSWRHITSRQFVPFFFGSSHEGEPFVVLAQSYCRYLFAGEQLHLQSLFSEYDELLYSLFHTQLKA